MSPVADGVVTLVYPWSDHEIATCKLICVILVDLSSASIRVMLERGPEWTLLSVRCQGKIAGEQEANKERASMIYSLTFEQPYRMADLHLV